MPLPARKTRSGSAAASSSSSPGAAAAAAADGSATRKQAQQPRELCGCGVDTYRPPPKGKKAMAPVQHSHGCIYQRTTCAAYPHLPRCEHCMQPCKHCAGLYRWCPHCHERPCQHRYKRVVVGWERVHVEAAPLASANATTRGGASRGTAVTFVTTTAAVKGGGGESAGPSRRSTSSVLRNSSRTRA